ncbi:MAG: hypothetical protein LBG97_08285 [Coriobacteriales bacterium]|nr:hypothetical protein [Coriobacteriales bacterium]
MVEQENHEAASSNSASSVVADVDTRKNHPVSIDYLPTILDRTDRSSGVSLLKISCINQEFLLPLSSNEPIRIGRLEQWCTDESLRCMLLRRRGVGNKHLEIAMGSSVDKIKAREPVKSKNGTFAIDSGGRHPITDNYYEFTLPVCIEMGNPNSKGVRIEVSRG